MVQHGRIRGETFIWKELKKNFIKYFSFAPKEVIEKHDRREITINNKQDSNIKTHYKRDIYIA